MTTPLINKIFNRGSKAYKHLRSLRKKYVFDLTDEQEAAAKEWAKELALIAYAEGKEVGIKIISDSIAKTINEQINKNL